MEEEEEKELEEASVLLQAVTEERNQALQVRRSAHTGRNYSRSAGTTNTPT